MGLELGWSLAWVAWPILTPPSRQCRSYLLPPAQRPFNDEHGTWTVRLALPAESSESLPTSNFDDTAFYCVTVTRAVPQWALGVSSCGSQGRDPSSFRFVQVLSLPLPLASAYATHPAYTTHTTRLGRQTQTANHWDHLDTADTCPRTRSARSGDV